MLTYQDIIVYGLSKSFPSEVVIIIFKFFKKEHIRYLVEDSRDYHINRMPIEIRKPWPATYKGPVGKGYYNSIKCNEECKEQCYNFGEMIYELKDEWFNIYPKGIEYKYKDIWKFQRFKYPHMNYINSFNRGRILLKFFKTIEWDLINIHNEYNIVDKLTDYKEILS